MTVGESAESARVCGGEAAIEVGAVHVGAHVRCSEPLLVAVDKQAALLE
jgi:hypothetical protein